MRNAGNNRVAAGKGGGFLPWVLLADGEEFRRRLAGRGIGAGGILQLAAFVCVACAVYGAVLAGWRSVVLPLYVAAKLPTVFVGATLVVAGCNMAVAALVGADLRWRDLFAAVFGAMALAGWILLALAPVSLFLVAAACPAEGTEAVLQRAHNAMLVTHVGVMGLAGLAGIGSLWAALRRMVRDGGRAAALAVAWVGTYAFVGTQLGWMLRPFVGSPFYPVVFLRPDAFDRNFYEFLFGEVLPFLMGFSP